MTHRGYPVELRAFIRMMRKESAAVGALHAVVQIAAIQIPEFFKISYILLNILIILQTYDIL